MTKVLIVDDDDVKHRLLKGELFKNGIKLEDILSVYNSVEALKTLALGGYDLLLIDLILPVRLGEAPKSENGLELLKAVVEDGIVPSPSHIVGVTADNNALTEHFTDFAKLVTQLLHVDVAESDWKNALSLIIKRINAPQQSNYLVDVCFLSALRDPEQSSLFGIADYIWQAEEPIGHGLLARKGQIQVHGKEISIVSAHCSNMGSICSSHAAQVLINLFKPKLLLMNGICGGIKGEAKIGDVLVAERSWDWQAGKYKVGNSFEISPDQKEASYQLVALLQAQESKLGDIYSSYADKKPKNVPKMIVGPMVSGSSVVADALKHQVFKAQHRKVKGVDMECFGLYYSANLSNNPRPSVLCVKSVSDLADSQKKDYYQKYCSYISSAILREAVIDYFK